MRALAACGLPFRAGVILFLCGLFAAPPGATAQPPDRRGVSRMHRTVVACEPMDLVVSQFAAPQKPDKPQYWFWLSIRPPTGADLEQVLLEGAIARLLGDVDLRAKFEISAEQLKLMKDLPPMWHPPVEQPWKAEVESLYVAHESAQEADRPKAAADLIAAVRKAAAPVDESRRTAARVRADGLRRVLKPEQWTLIQKWMSDPEQNPIVRFWTGPEAPAILKEGIYREEYVHVITGGVFFSSQKRAGRDTQFSAGYSFTFNSDLAVVDYCIAELQRKPELAKKHNVDAATLEKLKQFPVSTAPWKMAKEDVDRLKSLYEAWEAAPGNPDAEELLFRTAAELGKKGQKEFELAVTHRMAHIEETLGAAKLREIRDEMTAAWKRPWAATQPAGPGK